MKNQIVITFEGDYIQALSNGEKDYEFASRLWSQTIKACRENDCFNILGIANTTAPVQTMEVYDHAELFQQLGITKKYRIAWVELDQEAYQTTHFIETILSNRGFPGRVFADVAKAKKWLIGERTAE